MMDVNINLIPIKLYYFCYFAGISTFILFISHFCKTIGLSEDEIGIIAFSSSIVGFLSRSFCGAIVDKFNCVKVFLFFTPLLAAISFGLMLLVPKSSGFTSSIHITHNNSSNLFHFCVNKQLETDEVCWPSKLWMCTTLSTSYITTQTRNLVTLDQIIPHNNLTINKLCTNYIIPHFNHEVGNVSLTCQKLDYNYTCNEAKSPFKSQNTSWGLTFALVFFLRTLGYLFYTPGSNLLDTVTLQLIGNARTRFGAIRMFGSIGLLVFALIVSFADYTTPRGDTLDANYAPSLYIYAVIGLIMALSILIVKIPKRDSNKLLKQTLANDKSRYNMTILGFTSPRFLAFYGLCFVGGMCLSILENYVFIAVDEMFTTDLYFLRLMTTMMALSEIVGIGVTGWINEQIGEPVCLCLSLIAWSLRFLLYSIIYNKWLVLGIEVLHGASFAFMTCSIVTYAGRIAPKGFEATIQGLSQGIYMGLGNGAGSLIGGFLYKYLQARLFLRMASIFGVISAIIYLLCHLFLPPFKSLELIPIDDEDKKQSDKTDFFSI